MISSVGGDLSHIKAPIIGAVSATRDDSDCCVFITVALFLEYFSIVFMISGGIATLAIPSDRLSSMNSAITTYGELVSANPMSTAPDTHVGRITIHE